MFVNILRYDARIEYFGEVRKGIFGSHDGYRVID